MPAEPAAPIVRRCKALPWWPGTFSRGVYGWEHTRMGLRSICDFYWGAQALHLTGAVTSSTASGAFAGSDYLDMEAYKLAVYQPRTCAAIPIAGDGNYSAEASFIFSQPLHWDGLDGTFCPEMALRIDINHNVTPGEPVNLGYISTDPAIGNEVGAAYLLLDFARGLELPLYYDREGVLTNVFAEAVLSGTRWRFRG